MAPVWGTSMAPELMWVDSGSKKVTTGVFYAGPFIPSSPPAIPGPWLLNPRVPKTFQIPPSSQPLTLLPVWQLVK